MWDFNISSIKTEISRFDSIKKHSVMAMDLHDFRDVTIIANCVGVYLMVFKLLSINQGFEVSKFRISKNILAIPRLEFTPALMSV